MHNNQFNSRDYLNIYYNTSQASSFVLLHFSCYDEIKFFYKNALQHYMVRCRIVRVVLLQLSVQRPQHLQNQVL